MRTIFDPENRWLSPAPLELAPGNKSPVALDDTLTVQRDSGPVSVTVLGNDIDPEGAPLTLVSASAALGTAVAEADNTVTYTPPTGLTGFDTVVYEIADDFDQRATGQIDITIVELDLSVDITQDNTLIVTAADGLLDITITSPAVFAGTYQADAGDVLEGPVNIVPPTASGAVDIGETLTAAEGLWVHDAAAGLPTTSWQWLRAGGDIAGATQSTYVVSAADIGQALSVRQTLSDANGQRSAHSANLTAGFAPSDDPALIGWWDAADTSTISASAGQVSAWADKSGGGALLQDFGIRQPTTGSRFLNGLNVIDFAGAHHLERAEVLPGSGDVAFHMVLAIDGVSNAFEAVFAIEAANDFQIDANSDTQFDGRINAAGIGTSTALTGGPFSGAFVLSAVFDLTGTATAEVFISGVTRGTVSYTTAIDAASALYLMTNRSRNAWIDGAVAEFIVTGSTGNRAAYESYLSSKWGLS